MEAIEIIIILILFCLQLYFCWKVFRKTREISSFLPSIHGVRIKNDFALQRQKAPARKEEPKVEAVKEEEQKEISTENA